MIDDKGVEMPAWAETMPEWVKNTPYGWESGYVGKYDGLWTWQRKSDDMAWSAYLKTWVSVDSGQGSSFLDALVTNPSNPDEYFEIDELEDYIREHGPLPEGGVAININEP